ncbi:response regulator [Roseospira marina]|uniref:Response regulator n=1 Tax=Roseospira marina TaxID=140057 RepID=A0A5M6IBI2_9PROT|nr:hemerythrin domain-containing protein [Roseospira marina]KAA5605654.1 response regulator [Roseospira marina]MBB4313270.1 hemerythrin-like metal-binding protein [Roseospira marina]MBB5085989.1 hemerythrin-like metal-binding protein [Roseospira marina]
MAWTETLSVHSPTLDFHHQILLGCLNRMMDLGEDWRGCLPAVRRELAVLARYAQIHFFVEERVLARANAPATILQAHHDSHQRLLAWLMETDRAFKADPSTVPFPSMVQALTQWLTRHIGKEDRAHVGAVMRRHPEIEAEIRRCRYAPITHRLNLGRPDAPPDPADRRPLLGRHAAIAEGDVGRAYFLSRALRDQGMSVSQARDLATASALIETETPDLLFLDWTLPGATPLARRVYRTTETAVVACHFGNPLDILDACEGAGVANILGYPCRVADIATAAQTTLDAAVPLRALVLERAP